MGSPQLIVIDTPEGVTELQKYLNDFEYIAFDTETTGLTTRDEIIGYSLCAEPDKAYYVILQHWSNELQCLLHKKDVLDPSTALINTLKNKSLIMHNGIFDCMMVEAYFKVNLIDSLHTDTMILAHLLDENRRVGLKELARTMYGEDSTQEQKLMKESILKNGGTTTKADYEMYKADSQLMAKYGAKDALLTYKLAMDLLPHLEDEGLTSFFFNDESMPLLRGPTYDLNTSGLKIDLKALESLKLQLNTECAEAKAFVYREIAAHIKEKYPGTNKKTIFNIGSSSQLAWLIFGQFGLEFDRLTDEGKVVCKALGLKLPYTQVAKRTFIEMCERSTGAVYQPEVRYANGGGKRAKKIKAPWNYIACNKEALKKHATKYKWIARLLEYQKKTKVLNTYIEGIEERLQYGVIHPSFLQHGTTSGRYACRNPNFQNLPRDDKRVKECIVPRPGNVYVGADYSQLEPRVFAYFSQDKELMAAFRSGDDFYSVIGMRVWQKNDCTPKKDCSPEAFGIKYKGLRDRAKVVALASTYGATANQLAHTTGLSRDDTQQVIDDYFEAFPGVAKMMLESHEQAKTNGFVTNLFSRPRRIPQAKDIIKLYGKKQHAELPYDARKLLNLSVNHRIQSTGASIVNRAAIAFHKSLRDAGVQAKIVSQVHDSIIAECKETDAKAVAVLLQKAMENTVKLEGVELEAVPLIGKTLAEV